MSLYNMINGVSEATFFILPMLGKHPNDYPRFRDCFIKDEEHPEYDNHIIVYTRTGGGNRESYEEENNEIRNNPNFIIDYDDSYDSTFACWVFSVPEKWKKDFDKLLNGEFKNISKDYQEEIYRVFPKLKDEFKKIFNK